MVLNIRKECIVKHQYVFLFLTLVSLAIIICSWTNKKHIDEHNRTCPIAEINLQCTTLSNFLHEEISQTYAEINSHNHLFVKEYLNNHVPIKKFVIEQLTDRKPAAKLVGRTRCLRNGNQIQSMGKVLFGAINDGNHPSLGFLRNGVFLQNGRLIVPLTGTYLIYSSFHHRLQCSLPKGQTNADETPLVRHVIYRFNIRLGQDQEVASTSRDHIYCNCADFVDVQTEISTLVELRAGDEISVKLNDCSLLLYSDANFFGLRLI
ncbi:uncharacterized protein LOC127834935 [Dreissena polymorpha]|uniref:THD domain-containing protein n=1 Tax=Dreissena polymorpha TaxID=45954 RepID=A0A9D4JMQ7_DREPO|nr:uncharacterized protein LOC127834935 [Dreissena polymorpha]KAH3814488.1 hypothetical protein DPMN_142989 [Dreissena polymorpha]